MRSAAQRLSVSLLAMDAYHRAGAEIKSQKMIRRSQSDSFPKSIRTRVQKKQFEVEMIAGLRHP
jgi:hypothetical protein